MKLNVNAVDENYYAPIYGLCFSLNQWFGWNRFRVSFSCLQRKLESLTAKSVKHFLVFGYSFSHY